MRLGRGAHAEEFFPVVRVADRLRQFHRRQSEASTIQMIIEMIGFSSRAKRQPYTAAGFGVRFEFVDVARSQWTRVRQNYTTKVLKVGLRKRTRLDHGRLEHR